LSSHYLFDIVIVIRRENVPPLKTVKGAIRYVIPKLEMITCEEVGKPSTKTLENGVDVTLIYTKAVADRVNEMLMEAGNDKKRDVPTRVITNHLKNTLGFELDRVKRSNMTGFKNEGFWKRCLSLQETFGTRKGERGSG